MKEPEINLNGWRTLSSIAKERGCTTQNISQLIRRGGYEIRIITELNNLKLVKEKS